jgi:hypothetical protein
MADEKNEKLTGQKEDDYGFPFTEVTPLEAKKRKPEEEVIPEPIVPEIPVEEVVEPIIERKIESQTPSQKRKRSQLPLQFSLVMLILIILGAMAYFLYFLPEETSVTGEEVLAENVEEPSGPVMNDGDLTEDADLSDLTAVEEDEEGDEYLIEEEESTSSDVGLQPTATFGTGNIYEVRQGETSAEYHIIVSSTQSQQVALEQAESIRERNLNVWLLFPHGESRNYRISIAKYPNLAQASEALARHKEDFGDSIWILKY